MSVSIFNWLQVVEERCQRAGQGSPLAWFPHAVDIWVPVGAGGFDHGVLFSAVSATFWLTEPSRER